MSSLLSIGQSGLAAAYAGIATTGHNIANVNTPGYSRQSVAQAAVPGIFMGGGFIGRGVAIDSVQRAFDEQAAVQLRGATADAAEAATHRALVDRADHLLATDETGVGAAMSRFFSTLKEVASRPTDGATRAAVLSAAGQFVDRMAGAGEALDRLARDVDASIDLSVRAIGGVAARIAALNDAISVSMGNGQPPNDLLDQRDALLADLAQRVGITAATQSDGSMNVYLSNGTALVVGGVASTLRTVVDPTDGSRLAIAATTPSGLVTLKTDDIVGGALGGQLRFRDVSLAAVRNQLGRLALAVTTTLNALHAGGTDLNGQNGLALFGIALPGVTADPANMGGAGLSVGISAVANLVASDYRLTFDGVQYTVTRESDGTAYQFASLPAVVDGLDLQASGPMAAGDNFRITPYRAAASSMTLSIQDPRQLALAWSGVGPGDNRNALAMADVAEQALVGIDSPSQLFGQLAADVGARAQSLALDADANERLLDQARQDQSNASGVNLDEEAANLLRYQQAYQASAKVIAASQTLFDTLLSLGR